MSVLGTWDGWEQGKEVGMVIKPTDWIPMVIELFNILTVVVDMQAYTYDKIV